MAATYSPFITDDALHAMADSIDTGQDFTLDELAANAFSTNTTALNVVHHEIHRIDDKEDGGGGDEERDYIISTLKLFTLRVALQDVAGSTVTDLDGETLVASLVYDANDSQPVEELSATGEPPLLNVKAALEEGVATFRLRVTVLTSLCEKRNFRVRVQSPAFPELCHAVTAPFKTITKLRRGVREKAERERVVEARENTPPAHFAPAPLIERTANKRALDMVSAFDDPFATPEATAAKVTSPSRRDDEDAAAFLEATTASTRSLDAMWDAVQLNGRRLMELQAQQLSLYKELRALRSIRAKGEEADGGKEAEEPEEAEDEGAPPLAAVSAGEAEDPA